MAAIQVEIPPAAEPVSLVEAKNFLKVSVTADDTLIQGLIQAAREVVEAFLARSLVNKGYRQSLDSFPYYTDTVQSQLAYPPAYYSLPRYSTTLWNYSQMMKLFYSPLREVTKISYISSQDSQWHQLLPAAFPWQASTEYELEDEVIDTNGNLQEVTAVNTSQEGEDGTFSSGSAAPAWNVTVGATTTDGPLTWTNQGTAPAGDFIYDADSEPPRLFPKAGQFWPSVLYVPNAVQVHYIAGYGNDGKAVPQAIKMAIMQLVAHWYNNREPVVAGSISKLPNHVEALLWTYRVLDLAPTRG